MAEVVLSALLPVLFEKLTSAALKSIARYKGIHAEIKKWHRWLVQIQGVLNNAAQKEINNPSVKRWLNDLQHLAYDIDDVLDDLAYEAMDREFNRDSQAITITSKVRKLIPTRYINFSRSTSILYKLDVITAKLKDLVEERDALGLKVGEETGPRNSINNRRLQTSMVQASSIIGREIEKKALIQKLLEDGSSYQNFSIVPIVGMGGIGKTTLARLLYDEREVKDHFELKAWVCVSDEFDSFCISKVIFQAVTGVNKEFADLNLLQEELRTHLREKRFLLVLDDVWSESYEDWETLVGPFHACAPASKIIITTRKIQLLKKLGYSRLNQLQILSHDDALSLLALNALGVDSFDSHISFKPHAEGIVEKCNGLPLALVALGRLLMTKNDEESWKEVLHSEIWRSKDDVVVPALRLSYHDLSAPLKHLFAYCSLFPKDFLFEKEKLVLLWMAEGFLHQLTPSGSTEEHSGHECFDELLSRSFFQCAPNSESLFVMHDLLNDLATYVAGEFFIRLDNEKEKNIREEMLEKYRHMSFLREEYVPYKKFEAFKSAKRLRTFFATSIGVVPKWQHFYLSNKILVDLLPALPLLRVLTLSNLQISEVPESVGLLRHLRHVDLSDTRITHLPESLCNLYNLQTLILSGCNRLTKLPNNFLRLKNLRHLDIRKTKVLQMPLGIDELKFLQTLSKIIIGGESRFEITKLKDFKNLCGKVSIMGLDNVKSTLDARVANISQKMLSEFEIEWSDESDSPQNEMLAKEVLNELQPCNDKLTQLKIRSYGGLDFPYWVGSPSFLHLKHVTISDCKRCTTLPSLGQLPSIKKLYIKGLHGVEVVGLELFGIDGTFPSLEILSFESMHGWKKWSTNSGVVFPCLKELLIKDCPILVEVTLGSLPSLNVQEIYRCPNLIEVAFEALPSLEVLKLYECNCGVLRRLVQVASKVTKLTINMISGLKYATWKGIIKYLGAVEELIIRECDKLNYLWESDAVASKILVKLRELKVYKCDNLVSLGEKEEDYCRSDFLTCLRKLVVSDCKNMVHLSFPNSIEVLRVNSCPSIKRIPLSTRGEKLKSLDIRMCDQLRERMWGGQNKRRLLDHVTIIRWANLKSIIELGCLVHLTELMIENCKSLESFPDNELPYLTSLKRFGIIDCPNMDDCFPRGIWPPNLCYLEIGRLKKPISEWGQQNFPSSLVQLKLHGGIGEEDGVSDCSQISQLFPPSLTSLEIFRFERLESLNLIGLQHLQSLSFWRCPNLNKLLHSQHLTSLQHLSFSYCPNMMELRQIMLPSLLRLDIFKCPKLKERYGKGGCDRPIISHIPCIKI